MMIRYGGSRHPCWNPLSLCFPLGQRSVHANVESLLLLNPLIMILRFPVCLFWKVLHAACCGQLCPMLMPCLVMPLGFGLFSILRCFPPFWIINVAFLLCLFIYGIHIVFSVAYYRIAMISGVVLLLQDSMRLYLVVRLVCHCLGPRCLTF